MPCDSDELRLEFQREFGIVIGGKLADALLEDLDGVLGRLAHGEPRAAQRECDAGAGHARRSSPRVPRRDARALQALPLSLPPRRVRGERRPSPRPAAPRARDEGTRLRCPAHRARPRTRLRHATSVTAHGSPSGPGEEELRGDPFWFRRGLGEQAGRLGVSPVLLDGRQLRVDGCPHDRVHERERKVPS